MGGGVTDGLAEKEPLFLMLFRGLLLPRSFFHKTYVHFNRMKETLVEFKYPANILSSSKVLLPGSSDFVFEFK